MSASPFMVSDEVQSAVDLGQPVVALESTIFTHGLPRPRNLEVALEAEEQLRAVGVQPATIGIVGGQAVVGLSAEQITQLSRDDEAAKVSVRDLPYAASAGLSGGTTVAATSFLAHRAGVGVFATGGLGGVHRGASATFDESADLTTLAKTPVLVVSAGVKSILDVGASLERMETLSLTVVGYGTKRYPGFYVADSGFTVEHAVDTPGQVADLIEARDAFGIESAILLALPVPASQQLAADEHAAVLQQALDAAQTANIAGHDATPFLLDYIQRATQGRSLDVNVAVYRNNVGLAAEIAISVSKQLGGRPSS